MMHTHCGIESKIASACSYGSGNVFAPPTTKASYLIVHGTHDGVVIYQNLWDYKINKAVLSCCDYEWDGVCVNPDYYHLYAEGLGAAIATLRGYQGDIIGGRHPEPSSTLGLVDDTLEKCNGRINKCTSPIVNPNPWNTGFSCPATDGAETDILDYPVDTVSGAGPVQVWRINTWNHDYPNRRLSSYGPTEFFMQLRRFFNTNRGRKINHGTRSVEIVSSYKLCASPAWDAKPLPFTNDVWDANMTPERCQKMCLDDYQCADAFYIDLTNYSADARACQIWLEHAPCKNPNYNAFWADARHFRGSTKYSPTPRPTPKSVPTQSPLPTQSHLPTQSPLTAPTTAPTAPDLDMCPNKKVLRPTEPAGHSCVPNLGDSNGGFTEDQCKNVLGTWTPYDCGTANSFWLQTEDAALREIFSGWWVPKCCETKGQDSMCVPPKVLDGENLAGYSCVKPDGASPGDSNNGDTEDECVNKIGGTWTPYSCDTAELFWLDQNEEMREFYSGWWVSKCCLVPSVPTKSPISNAPTKSPTNMPSKNPTKSPTTNPTNMRTELPSVVPSTAPTPDQNACEGLSKKKCKKLKSTCVYGPGKIFGDCVPKKRKYIHDCSKYSNTKCSNVKRHEGLCTIKSGVCAHICDGLAKNSCRKIKNTDGDGNKTCKAPKLKNPCKGCQPKITCA